MRAAPNTSTVPPLTLGHDAGTPGPGTAIMRPRQPLPLPPLIAQRTTSCVYGLAALDVHGRIADRLVSTTLGWPAGLGLQISHVTGLLVVHPHRDGNASVTGQGHVRLPAIIRHQCGLFAGDRVLLAAEPDLSRLLIIPPAALDTFLTQQCSGLLGGEPA